MQPLSQNAVRILLHLVRHLPNVIPGDPGTYLGYRQVHQALGLELVARTWGQSLKEHGLAELAEWAKAHGTPAITGVLVNQDSFEPGEGFFKLYCNPVNKYQWWEEQVALAKTYDWDAITKPDEL